MIDIETGHYFRLVSLVRGTKLDWFKIHIINNIHQDTFHFQNAEVILGLGPLDCELPGEGAETLTSHPIILEFR